MNKKILLSTVTSLVLLTNSQAKETKQLDSIIVTAQKQEENIQQVPMSINVMDEFSIQDKSLQNTREISSYIPNFSTHNAGTRDYFTRISMRGISNTGIGDPAVALYVDEVSHADIYGFDFPLFDIERIEVLKGPQGTLYGKNSEGGVINIITRKPTNETNGQISLEAGSYNKRQILGNINTPIIKDKLFMKLSGLKSTRDGYVKNVYDNTKVDERDTTSLRGSFLYKANDNLEFSLTTAYNRFKDDGGYPMVPIDKELYKKANNLTNINDYETSFNQKGESSVESKNSVLKVSYTKDKYKFTSISGYRDMDNHSVMDGDFSSLQEFIGFNKKEADSINQEFRLSATESDSFKWIAGTYYNDEDIINTTGYRLDQIYANAYGVPLYTEDKIKADMTSKDIAIFTQGTYRILNNKLGITTGLRYEKSKRTMDKRTHTFGGVNSVPTISDLEKDSSRVLPKIAFDYQFNDKIMAYTSYAKGYKAGGFSYAVDDKSLAEYEPEISNAYEIGLKTSFPELGLNFNISGFYNKVDNYQDRVQLDPITVVQKNATEVDIKGLEIESIYQINNNFTFSGNLGITKATYGEYIDPVSKENYKNKDVSLIPSHDMNLALVYRNNFGIFAKIEAQNTGGKYFDRSNSKKLDSYTIYNTKIGYEQDKWDIYLDIKNITNKEYYLDGHKPSASGYIATVGNPRTINISLNYRF